jgi:type IV secretion system protein VirB5
MAILAFSIAVTNPAQASVIGKIFGVLKNAASGIAKQYGVNLETLNTTIDQLETVKEEIEVAKSTYNQAKGQLDTLKEMKELAHKKYGWGDVLNSTQDLRKLQYSASTWDETITNVDKNSDRYKKLLEHYTKQHYDISDDDFKKGGSSKQLEQYKYAKLVTANADAQATTTYNDINKRFENIHQLTKKIEKADNPKSATDLNSRLVAENANIQTEVLRQMTILNKQSALSNEKKLQQEAKEAREKAERREFEKLPDN